MNLQEKRKTYCWLKMQCTYRGNDPLFMKRLNG